MRANPSLLFFNAFIFTAAYHPKHNTVFWKEKWGDIRLFLKRLTQKWVSRLNRNLFCPSVKHEISGNVRQPFIHFQVSQKSDQWSWRYDNKKCLQTDSWTDKTDAGEFQTVRKATSRTANIIKGSSKGPSNLDSRYPSMPEPTGGLRGGGGGLVPRLSREF